MEATNNNTTNRVLNSVSVVGIVATEPKTTNFEKASVIRFALSVGERNKNTEGYTSALINVERWVKNEDLAATALAKGQLVAVDGLLKPQQWTSKDGQTHSRIIIGARAITEIPYTAKAATTEAVQPEVEAVVEPTMEDAPF